MSQVADRNELFGVFGEDMLGFYDIGLDFVAWEEEGFPFSFVGGRVKGRAFTAAPVT